MDEKSAPGVGVDDGYAAVKLAWYAPDGAIRTHSVLSRAQAGSLGVGCLFGENGAVAGYETEGELFTVSPFCEGETTRFPDFNVSPLARVLVHHTLASAGFAGQEVRIASGLPLDRYFREGPSGKRKDEARIARKVESFSRAVRRLDGGETSRIGRHEVFPQGLAAVADWLVSGNEGRTQLAPIGVVDIGGQTTDISVVNPDYQVNRGRLKTCDLGVLDVRDGFRRNIMSSLGAERIPEPALDVAMGTGAILHWGREVSVREERDAAIREIEARLANEILSVFGKEAASFETILFVGGGIRVFRNLPARFQNATIVPDPEFANARGFLKVLSLPEGS